MASIIHTIMNRGTYFTSDTLIPFVLGNSNSVHRYYHPLADSMGVTLDLWDIAGNERVSDARYLDIIYFLVCTHYHISVPACERRLPSWC